MIPSFVKLNRLIILNKHLKYGFDVKDISCMLIRQIKIFYHFLSNCSFVIEHFYQNLI